MNQHEESEMAAGKGGGITLTFAILFLLLFAYPVVAAILRDYESDMAMTTVIFGGPCLFLGTFSGLIGLARGHRRCLFALALMWVPIAVLLVLSIIFSALRPR